MQRPNVLILRAPGSNCDNEAQFAFEQAGAAAEKVHINRIRQNPKLLKRYQILVIPGGFTYGDDVAAGKILTVQPRPSFPGPATTFSTPRSWPCASPTGFR